MSDILGLNRVGTLRHLLIFESFSTCITGWSIFLVVSCYIYIPYILLQQEPVDKQWLVACGQAMVGGLWTNLSTWPVDKPGYVACGQIWICGSWKNLDMWLVDKPGYIACKQT